MVKWIFIVEAIGAVITGLVLIGTDEHLVLYGFLTMILGPIVAWIGSWILYAFGELVEKTSNNENNTRQILEKLNEENTNRIKEEYKYEENPITNEQTISKLNETPTENKEARINIATFSTTKDNTIICSQCKFEQPNNRKVCWNCGAKFENE